MNCTINNENLQTRLIISTGEAAATALVGQASRPRVFDSAAVRIMRSVP
jgi:hypothetical protein